MGRIGATLSGIERQLLNQLAKANAASALASLRLATGHKINAPRDNPAGFVLLSSFHARRSAALQTVSAVSTTQTMGAEAQLAIDQIRVQLDTIREKALADEDQDLTADQRAANQAAIDAAIAEINRLASSSQGDKRLLDGSADFTYAGVNSAQVRDVRAMSLGGAASLVISGVVTAEGTQAQLTHAVGGSTISSNAIFELSGARGATTFEVTAGESLADVVERVNQASHRTGVTAAVQGTSIQFTSVDYGSSASVAVEVTSGSFSTTGGGQATGTDAQAILNGRSYTAQGNRFSLSLGSAQAQLELAAGFSGVLAPVTISGSPPEFVVSPDLAAPAALPLPSLSAARLGGVSGALSELATGGDASGLGDNASQAIRIVDEALGQLTVVEGQVDGFVNQTLQSTHSLMSGIAAETQLAIDSIDGIDEEEELLQVSRQQVLAGNIVAALQILSDQRAGIVDILRKAAGLP